MKSFVVLLHGMNFPLFLTLQVPLHATTPGLCKISLPTSQTLTSLLVPLQEQPDCCLSLCISLSTMRFF